ncbi:hypothetical protein A3709_18835 [Halioglobus sp. HI00S01]|nr:hypothetical protein A3709_18835 [Halioglobus sp. HI00S01]
MSKDDYYYISEASDYPDWSIRRLGQFPSFDAAQAHADGDDGGEGVAYAFLVSGATLDRWEANIAVLQGQARDTNLWDDNRIQFPRLLAEIRATAYPEDEALHALMESTNLTPVEIDELFERADVIWSTAKGATEPPAAGDVALGDATRFKLQAEGLVEQLRALIQTMPRKGLKSEDCQRVCLELALFELVKNVNGVEASDFVEDGQ